MGTQTDTINTSELSSQTDDIAYNTNANDTQIQVGNDNVRFYKREDFYENAEGKKIDQNDNNC